MLFCRLLCDHLDYTMKDLHPRRTKLYNSLAKFIAPSQARKFYLKSLGVKYNSVTYIVHIKKSGFLHQNCTKLFKFMPKFAQTVIDLEVRMSQ